MWVRYPVIAGIEIHISRDLEEAERRKVLKILRIAKEIVRFSLPTTISPRYIPAGMEEDGDIPTHAKVHPP